MLKLAHVHATSPSPAYRNEHVDLHTSLIESYNLVALIGGGIHKRGETEASRDLELQEAAS